MGTNAKFYRTKGEIALKVGNYADAVQFLSSALENADGQDIGEITKSLEEATEIRKNIAGWLFDASNALREGNYEEVRDKIRKVLEKEPTNQKAYDLLEEARRKEEKQKEQGEAMSTQKDIAKWLFDAKKALREGNYVSVEESVQSILTKEPDNQEAHRILEEALREQREKQSQAQSSQEQADIAMWLIDASVAMQAGEYGGVRTNVQLILKKDPANREALRLLEEATKRDSEQKARTKKVENYINLGNQALGKKEYNKVIRYAEMALEIDSENAGAKNLLEEAGKHIRPRYVHKVNIASFGLMVVLILFFAIITGAWWLYVIAFLPVLVIVAIGILLFSRG
jgi:tetratricopeptide (TPR) repeat protein